MSSKKLKHYDSLRQQDCVTFSYAIGRNRIGLLLVMSSDGLAVCDTLRFNPATKITVSIPRKALRP